MQASCSLTDSRKQKSPLTLFSPGQWALRMNQPKIYRPMSEPGAPPVGGQQQREFQQ